MIGQQKVSVSRDKAASCKIELDDILVGTISVNDKVRSEAKKTIEALHDANIEVHMLSGDRLQNASEVAAELGIHERNVHAEASPEDKSKYLIAPMPGLLVSVLVKEKDVIEEGQPLAVIEAMKMENIIKSEKKAIVKKVNCKEGDSLEVDQIILEFV